MSRPPDDAGLAPKPGRAFRITVLVKGADAVLEVLGGLLVLLVSPAALDRFVVDITQYHLSRHPDDVIANGLRRAAAEFADAQTFASVYLLSHGAAKLVLVVAILRGHRWAYPGLIALLAVFIVYQIYRLTLGFSVGLVALTIFDAVVMWLTWRELKRWRRREGDPAKR